MFIIGLLEIGFVLHNLVVIFRRFRLVARRSYLVARLVEADLVVIFLDSTIFNQSLLVSLSLIRPTCAFCTKNPKFWVGRICLSYYLQRNKKNFKIFVFCLQVYAHLCEK